MIIVCLIVLQTLPSETCALNEYRYESTMHGDCCEEQVGTQYEQLSSVFGDEFTRNNLRVEEVYNDCNAINWMVEAREFGYSFWLMPNFFDPSISLDCDYGLREDGLNHQYHPYSDLERPAKLDELTKCACGNEYSYPEGSTTGSVMCNGDYVVGTHLTQYYESQEPSPKEIAEKQMKHPRFIDVERRAVYCNSSPYYDRSSGSLCPFPVVEPEFCEEGCSCTSMKKTSSLEICALFIVLYIPRKRNILKGAIRALFKCTKCGAT